VVIRKTHACNRTCSIGLPTIREGFKTSKLDYEQAMSNLRRPRPRFPAGGDMRQPRTAFAPCWAFPPPIWATCWVPDLSTAAPQVAVGMPAELLRRRADVRSAERKAAAQASRSASPSQLYPIFSIDGTLAGRRPGSTNCSRPADYGSVGRSSNEHPQLRPHPQQRALQTPCSGPGGRLPEHGAASQPGRGERHHHLRTRRCKRSCSRVRHAARRPRRSPLPVQDRRPGFQPYATIATTW